MRNRFARLPSGAYQKDLLDVVQPYMRKALKDTTYMKKILEVYPDKKIVYEMPEAVFVLLTNAYYQARMIDSKTTFSYIIVHLPDELKRKVKRTIIDHIDTDIQGMDYKEIYLEEYDDLNGEI